MSTFLIVGLGNIGSEYANTRHNIGFKVIDQFAKTADVNFELANHAHRAEINFKGKKIILIRPTTYMNLSGKAVRYWLQKEKIDVKQMMIIVDDIHIPFGTIRIRPNGADAGHNGLKDIQASLGSADYPRLRIGVGSDFPKGRQVEYVLGEWNQKETKFLPELIKLSTDVIESFCLSGLAPTMNVFNAKKVNVD